MPDDLYDRDALAWAEQQAELLTRLSRGERVNDAIDWEHLIDEVRDVGLSELRACTSLLRLAQIHLLKSAAWPRSGSLSHWAVELAAFLDDAQLAYSPSMGQRIDLGVLYAKALRTVARVTDDTGPPHPLPQQCPWSLDDLLAGDIDRLVGMLHLDD